MRVRSSPLDARNPTARQIDPICVPLQMSAQKRIADHIGGSARVLPGHPYHSA